MNSKMLCSKCSGEILPGDKFCRSCGAVIDWNTVSGETPAPAGKGEGALIQCPMCGHQNAPDNSHCASCGAILRGGVKKQAKPQSSQKGPSTKSSTLFGKLQSWKITVGVAVILIGVLLVFNLNNKKGETLPPGMPPDAHQSKEMMAELETLEKAVQANPTDAPTLLQLANHLQDAKFLPKAIEAYQKYLVLKPNDADAIVDLGVTYYESSMVDTMGRGQYLFSAQKKFEEALKINPEHQLAHFNLGIVSLMQGDLAGSTEWFKKTIAIDSSSETGKRAQMLIQQHSMKPKPTQ